MPIAGYGLSYPMDYRKVDVRRHAASGSSGWSTVWAC
jgi:hypothetical protein